MLSSKGQGALCYLTKFAKLIRLKLENSENPIVPLIDELTLLKGYLQLESLRFENIRYWLTVGDAIDRNTTRPTLNSVTAFH